MSEVKKDEFFNETIYSDQAQSFNQAHKTDHMKYLPGMEVLESDLLEQVIAIRDSYDYHQYTAENVKTAGFCRRSAYAITWN